MRVRIDREQCQGAGMCALTAPTVFDQDAGDGLVLVLDPSPTGVAAEAAHEAAGLCPAGVITADASGGAPGQAASADG
ncbi:ferredoxin [Streptomyces sp. NPDC059009]|uniref:ferredoxin n=1 Tax=Streptomyces sp. NPDC059009 TaxID=3346694 RepID=UPI0036C261A3